MRSSEVGPPQPLREATLRLWGAYEYLRANDLTAVSRTSRLLRSPDVAFLGRRLGDELLELAGVLTGEHRHTSLQEDLVLEGSQVCYWVYLCALGIDLRYDDLAPARHLDLPTPSDLDLLLKQIHATAEGSRHMAGSAEKIDLLPLLVGALWAVGGSCAWLNLDVLDVVTRDLRQMAVRPYMQAYMGKSGNG